jgi:hypothetical protein
MAASYPSQVRVFTTKQNVVDTVDASHPNSLQEEVVAIESTLGINPATSTTPNPSSTFNAGSNNFGTVSARLANLEVGVVADSHTQYIRKASDGTQSNKISAGVAANRPLILQGAANQSANLLEFQGSGNEIIAGVTPDGTFTGKTLAANIQGSVTAVPADATVDQRNANFTLALADKNKLFYLVNTNTGVDLTITIPAESSVNFPIGSQINFVRGEQGNVVFTATSPANVNATPGLKLRTRWSGATLVKVAANTWWLSGDLTA